MEGQILRADGQTGVLTRAGISDAIKTAEPIWIDFSAFDEEAQEVLAHDFKLHPLAIEDAAHFGQRPKFESYDTFVHLVVYGVGTGSPDTGTGTGAGTGTGTGAGSLVEVHCFYSPDFLITVHRDPLPEFDQLRAHAAVVRRHGRASCVLLLYRMVDSLVDSFFPILDHFDDGIDELEDEILHDPTESQLGQLFDMKRSLVGYRKVVTPMRDMFAGIAAGALELAGMTRDAERYYRDVYDHLIRISDLVDSYRDLLTSSVDTHLSVVSNRLNVVMKQLTIIATVFLPLSFITGFFGQNFSWLVAHIEGGAIFVGFGIGLEIATIVALVLFFRKRGWL
ncbi:MAG: magnesium transporter CorA family protein [Acidimicrobiales bacterium]